MEESRTESASCAPGVWDEQPSERANALVVLTPVPESRGPRDPWPGSVQAVVAGIAVLVIAAELGRRAGMPARLAVTCSAVGAAVALVPRLVSATTPRHRPRRLRRHEAAAAVAH
ncbi:MAG TPA: hypothetical protein VIL71_05830 [Spirillospora sp.]